MNDNPQSSLVPAARALSPSANLWQAAKGADSNTAFDLLAVAAKVVTSPKETVFSGLRLIRAATAHRFTEQLRAEWAKYVEDGKIKADYARTDQAQAIFADTLESLAETNFDAEQLGLLRRLFLAAASESQTDRDNLLVREYIAIGLTPFRRPRFVFCLPTITISQSGPRILGAAAGLCTCSPCMSCSAC